MIIKRTDVDSVQKDNDTLLLPKDSNKYQFEILCDRRETVICKMDIGNLADEDEDRDGPIREWYFYIDEEEITWDNLHMNDKVFIVKEFYRAWWLVEGDIIPWGDDIETLIALERM